MHAFLWSNAMCMQLDAHFAEINSNPCESPENSSESFFVLNPIIAMSTPATDAELLESQKQRYDRQIRVWGADAQNRIQKSSVLICGLRGLHVEVVKNIVLAGMNTTIQDSEVVGIQDLATNFFLDMSDIGRNTAEASLDNIQQLNTYTTVGIEKRSLAEMDEDFLRSFSVILVDDCSEADAVRINSICRSNTTSSVFFLSGTFGLEGWFISDFGTDFKYKNDAPNNKITKTISFPSIEQVFKTKWNSMVSRHFPLSKTYVKSRVLRAFITQENRSPLPVDGDREKLHVIAKKMLSDNNIDEEFLLKLELNKLPSISRATNIITCSTLGSFLAQEVIKGVSLSGEPGLNIYEFSGYDCSVRAIPCV